VKTALALLIAAAFFGCKSPQKENKPQQAAAPETAAPVATRQTGEAETGTTRKNACEIFDITPMELFDKQKVVLVSLSDVYNTPEGAPYSIPPEAYKDKTAGQAPYIPLEGIYRQRMLEGTDIKETDSLYVYNYAHNTLKAFPVKTLKACAVINGYSAEGENVEEWYYMIGFELPGAAYYKFENQGDYDNLVYIGPQNIFVTGQMKPIRWQNTGSKALPLHKCTAPANAKKLKNENVMHYAQDGFDYYVQDGIYENDPQGYSNIDVRHLVVTDSRNNVVTDLYIKASESSSPATLNNFSNPDETTVVQYTGTLFKDKPPVILGLEWASFGCVSIEFLSPDEPEIYINCDNRH
jgi:hypothetical protein